MKIVIVLLSLSIYFQLGESYKWPHCAHGRTTIVHLFEWKWSDIEKECTRFLGPKGFCGVQVSPPNEHAVVYDNGVNQPWWQRYQPVSYKLNSRSGSEDEFKRMVETCNNANVRIYVDAVINHMARYGGWGSTGSGGSGYNPGTLSYPAANFGPNDFNCCNCGGCSTSDCNIHSYQDANQIRNCRLVSLPDLATGSDYVRQQLANFLNKCIGYGVAGFRIDATKHMWPNDVKNIVDRLHNLNGKWFSPGARPYIFQEVIDLGGEPVKNQDYLASGAVTEFKYGMKLGKIFRKRDGEKVSYLSNWGEPWGFLSSGDALVFIDNHDNQRGHGAGGKDILSLYFAKQYKMAVEFMLAHPYGTTRLMSSYWWDGGPYSNDWIGPPHHGDYSTKDVTINQDNTCGNGWACEHRWRQITNMVTFRNAANGQGVTKWWSNNNHQIAFSRGSKAFIAINNDDGQLRENIPTDMPSGTYCDIISGNKKSDNTCTGKKIYVSNGKVWVDLNGWDEDPVLAIHSDTKIA